MILISDIPKNVFLNKLLIKLSNWKLDHDITTQSKPSKKKMGNPLLRHGHENGNTLLKEKKSI